MTSAALHGRCILETPIVNTWHCIDGDLQIVISNWCRLPEAVRNAIVGRAQWDQEVKVTHGLVFRSVLPMELNNLSDAKQIPALWHGGRAHRIAGCARR